MCVCVCVCVCARACVRACVCACVRACARAYLCMRACTHVRGVRACVRVCVCAHVRASACTRATVHVAACMRLRACFFESSVINTRNQWARGIRTKKSTQHLQNPPLIRVFSLIVGEKSFRLQASALRHVSLFRYPCSCIRLRLAVTKQLQPGFGNPLF